MILALLCCVTATAAWGQRIVHRVRFNETLSSISKEYYGSGRWAVVLAQVNGRSADSKLEAGERIRIPTAWVFAVQRPTALSALAKQLFGGRHGVTALAVYNQITPNKRLRRGERLIVPFTVTHTVSAGETFASIADRYTGDGQYAAAIAAYNKMERTEPSPGTTLIVPIGNIRIEDNRLLDLVNRNLLGISADAQREDREGLQEANSLLRQGDYWHVPLRLIQLLSNEQSADTHIAEVYKLLAIAYVALGQNKLASLAFREALLRYPSMTLDPVTVSPKIIQAYVDAKRSQTSP